MTDLIDRDGEILSWLRVILAGEGLPAQQVQRIEASLTDAIVNHLGDD